MKLPIVSVPIHYENDTVAARQRARQIARFLGFDAQDQTRISTAVSEIARNAFNYAGGGRVEYSLEGRTAPQVFIIKVTDTGPGIARLETILSGQYKSETGMGLGIIGARRLMDRFDVQSKPGAGTSIVMTKLLPKRAPLIEQKDLGRLADQIARERPQDAFQELQHQNRELLAALEEIRTRQNELSQLNRELEDTNRGVVALYAELDEKADHLRRADELKSKFLSNMSHEFRSPLNSILALSGLLLNRVDGDLSPDQDQQVQYIKRAAQDLLDLVNDLLDLAKVEAGKVDVKPVEFRASDLFAALRGMLRPLLTGHSVDLVFDDAETIPPIYSDEGKVSQILRNFLSNALKFTEKGEVRTSATLVNPDTVEFSVSDTGMGIAGHDLEAIFQDFVQVDHPIQKTVKGTGLGLPLSRKLSALLGGGVHVQSELGIGSTFSLKMPLRYKETTLAAETKLPQPVLDPFSFPIVVVDDGPEMLMIFRNFLRNSGYQMFPATTTREALDLIDRVTPSAIVLDIVLRAEDTWALLARLKADSATKDIPILIVSTIEDQAKAFHLGANGYLVKPFERGILLDELNKVTLRSSTTRLLLIDDEERDRYVLQQQLKDSTIRISTCENGSEGFSRALEQRPDVILLDLEMPERNGFEVLDMLKAEPLLRKIPVLIVTSRVLTEAERGRLDGKAHSVFSKGELSAVGAKDKLRNTIKELSLRSEV
ncbi:MAG: ATP-binding protein [Bryobacteraceae bacterium]